MAPSQIDWDALPEDLAEEFLALNARIVALQPGSGGLVIDENGATKSRFNPKVSRIIRVISYLRNFQ